MDVKIENMALDKKGNLIVVSDTEVQKRIRQAEKKQQDFLNDIFQVTLRTKDKKFYLKKDIRKLLKDMDFIKNNMGNVTEVSNRYKHSRDLIVQTLNNLVEQLQIQLLNDLKNNHDVDVIQDIKYLVYHDYEVLLKYKIRI